MSVIVQRSTLLSTIISFCVRKKKKEMIAYGMRPGAYIACEGFISKDAHPGTVRYFTNIILSNRRRIYSVSKRALFDLPDPDPRSNRF